MKKQFHIFPVIYCLVFISFTGCEEVKSEQKTKVVAPTQIVEIPQAKQMYEAYEKRRVPLIERYEDSITRNENKTQASIKPFDATRFVHYDYQTIKQYMEYIEQEAKAANVEISTLRFYFSNYPDKEVFPGTKEPVSHPKQNSIMLSPTYNDGKREYLFYIGLGEKGPRAIPLNDSFGAVKEFVGNTSKTKAYASMIPEIFSAKMTPSSSLQGGNSLTLNRGTGTPPPPMN